jgi:zinc protease
MIKYNEFTLENGLRVLVHEDHATPMVAINIVYDVGARDEHPEQTGFAHLFEHLMFGGSKHIPSYDTPLQRVGGENNAFTSNDLTNYHITLPANNIETAFWLESDRMLQLAFSDKSLEVQKNVVVEEFKQRYLNQPYGDVWLKLRPLAYQVHPYRWATIGKELSHIENAEMEDVKAFFKRFYHPSNAILAVAGDVKLEQVKLLAQKWFGPIPSQPFYVRNLPQEPEQLHERRMTVEAKVPNDSLYMTFHGVDRLHPSYYAMDLITDLLSRGTSSRLYQALVKEQPIFSEINAYITGSIDSNLVIVEGKPLPEVDLDFAEALIWQQLTHLTTETLTEEELDKVKNKTESLLAFSELSILDKAMNLAYFKLLGIPERVNEEAERYQAVRAEDIQSVARQIFRKENSSTLHYIASKA